MKDILKRSFIQFPLLAHLMFSFFKIKNGQKLTAECERRKNISLFDYTALSQPLPYGPEELVIDNNLYGHAHYLKKFAGIKNDLNAYLEHGVFWGGMVHADQKYWYTKRIITFGDNRKKAIEKKLPAKEAVCVGPYIHYADELFNPEKMALLKAKLGRVLLVFPSHSIVNQSREFSLEDFITEVNRIKVDFDTVLVSLYFLDALKTDQVKRYEQEGFRIVTSGHRFDRHFIARHRTIISLADMTVSNSVGTHIGYCVYLGKPHYIFKQEHRVVSTSDKELQRHTSMYDGNEKQKADAEMDEVVKAFATYSPHEISTKQKEVVEKYWGISSLKSPKELRSIFGS